MNSHPNKPSPSAYARTIGILYLVIFFLGPVAFFLGRNSIFVPDDPAATVSKLLSSGSMFRLGTAVETVIVLVEIVVSALLYVLFRPVSKPIALASSLARFAQSVLQAVNLFTAVPAFLLLGGTAYLSSFSPDQVNALVQLFMDVNSFVIIIWGLIFGFHLVLLGYLVYKSGFLPKILGILLLLGSLGYLLQSYGHILAPKYDNIFSTVVVILSVPGELAFTLWLLIKGVNTERWEALDRQSA